MSDSGLIRPNDRQGRLERRVEDLERQVERLSRDMDQLVRLLSESR